MMNLDIFAPQFLADPYPTYALLRRTDPVHRTRFGQWVLTRYEDVTAAFHDERLSRSLLANEAFRAVHAALPDCVLKHDFERSLTQRDGAEHIALRSKIAPAFQVLETDAVLALVSAWVDEWLSARSHGPAVDLHATLSRPLAMATMAAILGIADVPAFRDALEHFLVKSMAPGAQMDATIRAAETIEAMVDDVVARGTCAFVSMLAANMDRPAFHTLVRGLISAGIEPLEALFDIGAWSLATEGAVRRALVETPADAVRELLRWRHVGRFVSRVVKHPFSLQGRELRAGDMVLLGLASALRDEQVFPDPDTFDPGRPSRLSRIFGHGPTTCLANRLSVSVGEVVLGALARSPYDFEAVPRWAPNAFMRTMQSLTVTAARRGGA